MSILTMEYDVEMAKKVYGEELLKKERIDIARNLLEMGLSKEQISKATGLSIDEILEIESEM